MNNSCCDPCFDPCKNTASLRGKSAYEIWVDQQGQNSDTSLAAFWASLQGPAGPAGATGIVSVTVAVEPIEN